MTLIKIDKVSKIISRKNNKITLLHDISLEIEQGEFLGIIGESGAGKSTLLNIIAGLDNDIEGNYFYGDKRINELSNIELAKFRNSSIGIVFQDFFLINHYTVLKNILLPLDYSKKQNNDILDIDKLLKDLKIKDLKNEKVENLSGGEKQRVAIARAIVNNPDIIVADEPTGALDSENSKKIMGIFRELNQKGKTIVLVTHDNFISSYCSKVIEIIDGEIKE